MKRLIKLQEEYKNISVPEDLDSLIAESTKNAKHQRHLLHGIHVFAFFTILAIAVIGIVFHTWKLIM